MKIYAILANPDRDSFCSQLFYRTIDTLCSQNYDVDILNLYERMSEIPYYTTTRPDKNPTLHTNKFFNENKNRFMQAESLFIVYPIFWYSVPGILKTWIDLITNYAWKYEGGKNARALHGIKRALIVNTSMESWWYRRFFTPNPSRRQIELTFDFMGIPDYDFYEIGSVQKLNSNQKENYFKALGIKSFNYFSR